MTASDYTLEASSCNVFQILNMLLGSYNTSSSLIKITASEDSLKEKEDQSVIPCCNQIFVPLCFLCLW